MFKKKEKRDPDPTRKTQEILPPVKDKYAHLTPTKWKPGQSGNPIGRPKGSRTKFAETFLRDFLADFEEHGAEVIEECRVEHPETYLRVAASLLPKELNIKEGESILETLLAQFSPEQLDEFITGLLAFGNAQQGEGSKVKAVSRRKPNGIH